MSPDAIDISLIFAFVVCVLVLGGVSLIRSAYRMGHSHGVLHERQRRAGVEARVAQAIDETFKSAEWERELDV